MSCKPNIYVANTNSTSVVANGIVPLGSQPVRRRGCDINLSGNSIAIIDEGSNYYKVSVSATLTAPAAGNVILNLQRDGTNVTGATATTSIATATTEVRNLSFTAIVRTFDCCGITALTLVNAGVAATYTNVAVTVEKL
jgi:hypothetical protein